MRACHRRPRAPHPARPPLPRPARGTSAAPCPSFVAPRPRLLDVVVYSATVVAPASGALHEWGAGVGPGARQWVAPATSWWESAAWLRRLPGVHPGAYPVPAAAGDRHSEPRRRPRSAAALPVPQHPVCRPGGRGRMPGPEPPRSPCGRCCARVRAALAVLSWAAARSSGVGGGPLDLLDATSPLWNPRRRRQRLAALVCAPPGGGSSTRARGERQPERCAVVLTAGAIGRCGDRPDRGGSVRGPGPGVVNANYPGLPGPPRCGAPAIGSHRDVPARKRPRGLSSRTRC